MNVGRIFKRGRIWWIAWSHGGKEYRESSKSDRASDARALLQARVSELYTTGRPINGDPLVSTLLDGAEAEWRLTGLRGLRQALGHMNPIRAALGALRASELIAPVLRKYAADRRELGRAPATVNRELAALSRAMTLAHKGGLIRSVPTIPRLEESNTRRGILDHESFRRLMAGLPPDLQDLTEWAWWTGWRRGEAITLAWSDVDWENRRLVLHESHAKTGEPRAIPLVGPLLEVLRRRMSARRPGLELVFHWGGKPIQQFRKTWNRAAQAAGVPGLLFHDLRRSALTNLIRAGVDQKTARTISGHKTDAVFWRYCITTDDTVGKALRMAQDRFSETEGTLAPPNQEVL